MNTTVKPSQRTPEQRRANHAWDAVQQILAKPPDQAKRIGGQAKKLPTRILASGLGQALAFLRAKNHAPEVLICLGDWILDKRANPDSKKPAPDDRALVEAIVKGSSDFLRRATDEALAYLQWLNRFTEAEGLLEGD
jgi:CRISPR-associated protein Cmr5